jgi:mannosyltransferase
VAASRSQSLARLPGMRGAGHQGDQPDRLAASWIAVIPALITLAVTLYRIGVPSFTRDEGATVLAVHRSFGQLLRMLGKVDVVHAEYYALVWVATKIGGSGELAVRAPSAVAMAVAAGVITLLGQRLVSGRAGLAAGLLFAVLPPVSFYAEDAREYAVVAALATVSSYLLIRALDSAAGPATATEGATPPPAGQPRYGWLAGYAAALALLGLANVLSLLLIAAHAVTVAVWRRHHGGPGRAFMLRWLISAAAAVIVASPVAIIASGQLHQVQWIKRPGLVAIIAMEGLIGPQPLFLIVVVVIAAALLAGLTGGRARLRSDWPPGLCWLAVPWLVVPPVLLYGVSILHLTHPLYVFRYIAFCIPAAALLAGTALAALARAALGRALAVAALIVIVIAALPALSAMRAPTGHGYGIRFADQAVARLGRPGDALLNVRYWPIKWGGGVERGMAGVYPYGLGRLHDISRGRGPVASASLGGTFARTPVERQRLAGVTRVWVASWSPAAPSVLPARLGFTLAYTLHAKGVWLYLYTRPHTTGAAGPAVATARPVR